MPADKMDRRENGERKSRTYESMAEACRGAQFEQTEPKSILCEKNGLKVSTLDYWRQRLGDVKEKEKKERGWISVQIQDESESGVDLRIGKITVTVKPGFDRTLLTDVLRILGAQC
jgi:hypothetical protein